MKILDTQANTEEVLEYVRKVKAREVKISKVDYAALLSERHPIYKNRDFPSIIKIKSHVIESFSSIGMPSIAIPYINEELSSSMSSSTIVACAKAVRSLDVEVVSPSFATLLLNAFYNIWQGDSYVTFYGEKSTAIQEIFITLSWMKGKAKNVIHELIHIQNFNSNDLNSENNHLLNNCIEIISSDNFSSNDCCDDNIFLGEIITHNKTASNLNLKDLKFEDQNGDFTSWETFFCGKYTVLSFFYSRCHNPRKCTKTIFTMGEVQKAINKEGLTGKVNTAAITYEPQNDNPEVLKQYGLNRNFTFDDSNKMLRSINGLKLLFNYLNLGVNFKEESVNVHRIEVYIINPKGEVEKSFLRFQAKPEFIIDELKKSISNGEQQKKKSLKVKPSLMSRFSTVVLPVLIAFFPKCPMCWAAYLNLIGISGIVTIPHIPWLIYVFIGLASLNFYNLYRLGKKRNGFTPLALASIGTFFLAINYWYNVGTPLIVVGILFTMSATLLNSLSFQNYHKLMHSIQEQWLGLRYKWS